MNDCKEIERQRDEYRDALQALMDKLDILRPKIDGAFMLAFTVRGHKYTGPNWSEEYNRAVELLSHKDKTK